MTDLLDLANRTYSKSATSVLWKYADPEGKEFYLLKKLTPVRSPYSGKSFTVKPERVSLSDIGKELKSDAKAEKVASDSWKSPEASKVAAAAGKTLPGSLWEYSDEEGNKFYLPKKQTGALKSPFTGKTFTSKPVKNTLSDVGKDLKEMAKKADAQGEEAGDQEQEPQAQEKEASGDPWKVDPSFAVLAEQEEQEETQQKTACAGSCNGKCGGGCGCPAGEPSEATLILDQGEAHPALQVLLAAYQDIVAAVTSSKVSNDSVKASALESIVKADAASLMVFARVLPKIRNLARVASIVASQMEEKVK